jgi:hypothetical protein
MTFAATMVAPECVRAHCDTLDGPVVTDAKAALAAGDVTAVLKWVRPADEPEIRAAFGRAIAARKQGEDAREVADGWFFETVVRVHRAGEGAPYDGLKPAGTFEPGIAAADRALDEGSVDALVEELTAAVAAGVRERFVRTHAARQNSGASVASGRAYVAAYVEFVHYVEKLHAVATDPAGDGHERPNLAAHDH